MAARVCEPITPSIEPEEKANRAKATCISNVSRGGRGKLSFLFGVAVAAFVAVIGLAKTLDCAIAFVGCGAGEAVNCNASVFAAAEQVVVPRIGRATETSR